MDTSLVSYDLSQFWPFLPRDASNPTGEGLIPARLSPPATLDSQPQKRQNGYGLEIPNTSSLSSIDLLEWLTEHRERFYLVDYWFITKG